MTQSHETYGVRDRDALRIQGGLNIAAEQSHSQSASAKNGNRLLLNVIVIKFLCIFLFVGYLFFLMTFAVISSQGAMLSNQRGIIYQVTHDDM